MDPAVWVFLGTLVGALASIATTSISNWNTFRIQKNLKNEERIERSRTFQRETILELQEELVEYIRFSGEAYFEQRRYYKDTGKWGTMLSPELNENFRNSSARTAILIERLIDEDIRKKLAELKELINKGILAQSNDEAESYQRQAADIFIDCNKDLGVALRSNY